MGARLGVICKPIFVVGVAHSGTTILYRMLAQHPAVAWFSQYSLRGGEIPGRMRFPLYNLINRIGRQAFGVSWHKEFGGLRKLLPTPMEANQIWAYLLPDDELFFNESDYANDVARRMIQIMETECKIWDKDRLLVKMPRLARAVLLLNKIFRNGLFVHVLRDGKAVALSNQHKFTRSPWGPSVALRQSAEHWKDVVVYLQNAVRKIGEDKIKTVKYECLCEDVKGTIEEIIRFCDLPASGSMLDHLPTSLTPTNEKWFSKCSYEDKILINNVLAGVLKQFEYDPFSEVVSVK